jgi:hypothetical protein
MIILIMPLRDKLPKLLADAQAEQNPELLERIAVRLQDALADKVRYLRSIEAPNRKSKTAGS